MGVVRDNTARPRQCASDEFRRFLVISALLHLGGFALLGWIAHDSAGDAPEAISVDLVAAPAGVRRGAGAARPGRSPSRRSPRRWCCPKEPTPPNEARARRRGEAAAPEPRRRRRPNRTTSTCSSSCAPSPARRRRGPGGAGADRGPAGGGAGPGRPGLAGGGPWMRNARIHVRRNWIMPPAFECNRS